MLNYDSKHHMNLALGMSADVLMGHVLAMDLVPKGSVL